jgi:phospholipid transport system substrate-binding protein
MSFSKKILCVVVLSFVLPLIAVAQTGQNPKLAAIAQTTTKDAAKTIELRATPTKAIQELDGMLDDFNIGSRLTAQQEEENRELKRKIIHGTFDIRELSRLALAKHWTEITPADQDNFVKLLTDLLEEKALFSKEQIAAKSKTAKKYRIVYRGDKFLDKEQKVAFTRTRVFIPSENIDIALNYKLKRQNGDWKIFDVIVDEASLVDNYRYQFDSIIKKSGYQDLVRRMTEKLDEIKRKRQASN